MKTTILLIIAFGFTFFELNAQSLNYDFTKLRLDTSIRFVTSSIDTVGFYKNSGNSSGQMGLIQFDTLSLVRTLPITEWNRITKKDASFQYIKYEFSFTSDYLRQSAIIRERAIKNELYSKVVGLGLAIIGGATIANGVKQGNQENVDIGTGLIFTGGAVSFIGWCISIDLNLESNSVLSQCRLK